MRRGTRPPSSRLRIEFCSIPQGHESVGYLGLRMRVVGSNIPVEGDIASQESEILMSYLGTVFGILLNSMNEARETLFR